MSACNSFTTKASTSYAQTAVASSAPTPSIMNGTRLLRNSDARSTSAIKAIISFLFECVQLPGFFSHYASFFAGFISGALGGPALYAFFCRNQCDRAKFKLAVHHILCVIQHGPEYNALLGDPEKLLKRIDAEVMRLVDKHLTQNEAAQVTRDVKRNFAQAAVEEPAHKRVRQNERDVVKECMGPYLMPAHEHSLRGFIKEPIAIQPCDDDEPIPKPKSIFDIKSCPPFGTPEPPRCDSPLQPDASFVLRELGVEDDQMDIHEAGPSSSCIPHVPLQLFGGASCTPATLSTTPAPQQSILAGRVNLSTPALDEDDNGYDSEVDFTLSPEPAERATQVAEGLQEVGNPKSTPRHDPKAGSFGLDYDGDIYSSADDEALPVPGAPPVKRMLGGKKCFGTQLSPVSGSPSQVGGLPAGLSLTNWSTNAELEFSSSGSESEKGVASPAVHMATQPDLEYSSPGSPGAMTTPHHSQAVSPESSAAAALAQEEVVCASVEETGGPKTPEPEIEQENVTPSPPSRKRRSPSCSPSSTPKRTRITPPPLSGQKVQTPSPHITASPNKRPYKAGRGRGYTGPGQVVRYPASAEPAVPETPRRKKTRTAAKTPGTRKSSRLEEKMKAE